VKGVLKSALVSLLGYPRFLVVVSQARYLLSRILRRRSEFWNVADFVSADRIVLDVGANIGYTAALLADRPSAGVFAFEPDPDNFVCLAHVLRRRQNTTAVPCGIGASDGSAKIDSIVVNGVKQHALTRLRHSESSGDEGAITTRMRSIDSFVANLGNAVGFIKIDVEGFETEVLRGMSATISRDRPSLYVEICGDESLRQYEEFSRAQRYAVYQWQRKAFVPVPELVKSGNYLLVPSADEQ
jgi:FkbM family methyltransferase